MTYDIGYKKPPSGAYNARLYETPSASELRLLYHLNDMADAQKTRTVKVSQKELARFFGTSPRRIQAMLKGLIDAEYVLVRETKTETNGRGVNLYTILNPDSRRHEVCKHVAEISGIPLADVVEYLYWLNFHREKLKARIYPSLGDLAILAHCPAHHIEAFVRALSVAGVLKDDRTVVF